MKLSQVKLSDSYVAKLKAGVKPGAKGAAAGKYCVWDNACPGFGVEVTPAGGKLLVVKTCRDGIRAWHTLGRWPMLNVEDARTKAYALKDQVKKGEDPKAAVEAKKAEAAKKKLRPTVNQLCDRFIRDHIKAEVELVKGKVKVVKAGEGKDGNAESTAREHVRLIEKHIRATLGALPVEDVGTAQISTFLGDLSKETPIQANRVRSVLGKMFVRAELWGLRPAGSNPVPAQDRAPETKRERNLSDVEIAALGAALRRAEHPEKGGEPMPAVALAAIRLPLLTGMRKGEVLGLRWEWIDLEGGTATIPATNHKTGRKTGKVRLVRLCQAACELLRQLPRVLGNPFVLPGHVRGQALVNIQDPWEVIREAAGLDHLAKWLAEHTDELEERAKKAGKIEKVRSGELSLRSFMVKDERDQVDGKQVHYHDLRRSFASVGARMGYPELFIGALLGHSAGTVTAIYARVSGDPLREAAEAIGGRVSSLLQGAAD